MEVKVIMMQPWNRIKMQIISLPILWSAHLYQDLSNRWQGIVSFFFPVHTFTYTGSDMTFRINEGTPRTIRFLNELKEPRISHLSTECEYPRHSLLFFEIL